MLKRAKYLNLMFVMMLLVSIVLPFINVTPVHATGWLTGWSYRITLTIDETKIDTANLTDFPLPVKLVDGTNFTASHALATGNDIRFTSDDGTTLLKYEREYHTNAALGSSYYWVKVPTVTHNANTIIYCYYGNAGAADGADPTNVWNANFSWVQHCNDLTTSSLNDSTANNRDGTKAGANAPIESATASMYKSQYFDEAGDYFSVTRDITDYYSILLWIRPETPASNYPSVTSATTNKYCANIYYNDLTHTFNGVAHNANNAVTTATTATEGTYYAVVYTVNDKVNKIYLNANAAVSSTEANSPENDNVHTVGRRDTNERYFKGYIDEIQVLESVVTAEWAKAFYYAMANTLVSYSAETGQVPEVTTTANVTSLEETSCTASANITDTGSTAVTIRGFEYDVDSGSPYANDTHEHGSWSTDGTVYSLGLTGLTKGELYFFRGYATNTDGTGYGAEYTFQTKPDPPNTFTATMAAGNNIDLTWNKGTGAGLTYIIGKLGSAPASRIDGTYSWNGAGNSVTHAAGTADQHWYYMAWSETTHAGYYTQQSDTPDATDDAWTSPQFGGTTKCTGRGDSWATFEVTLQGSTALETFDVVTIEYGKTTAYGSSTARSGAWHSGDKVLFTVRGLTKATPYHFRSNAHETGGLDSDSDDDTFSTTGSPSLFEYLNTGGDGDSNHICSANWTYQTFTTDDTAHTVTSVRLSLKRVGAPGDVTISLKYANAAGDEPTGEDICVATLDGDALSTAYSWYEVTFSSVKSVEASTPYAIVVRALDGDYASNYILWQKDTGGGLANANNGISADGGISWTADTADQLFELWGYTSLRVLNAKVFTGYLTTGDWLVTAETENTYPPYYNDNADPSVYFYLQFVDTNTGKVEGATPCRQWGRQPLGIYLSPTVTSSLTWSGNYTARLYYTEGGDYQEYPLTDIDWRGNNLQYLDQWIITTATSMGDYYSATLVTTDQFKSNKIVLNSVGGAYFALGIPSLESVRPDIFSEIGGTADPHLETTPSHAYVITRDWQTSLGAQISNLISSGGSLLGIDTTDADKLNGFAGIVWLLLYMGLLMILGVDRLDGWSSIALGIPFVVAGGYIGIIPLTYLFGIGLIAIAIRLWSFFSPS
ncbi:MAG: DUF2341 domain-containing protein [Patescibacteria group bacterium]